MVNNQIAPLGPEHAHHPTHPNDSVQRGNIPSPLALSIDARMAEVNAVVMRNNVNICYQVRCRFGWTQKQSSFCESALADE
jgi:hypothetical protein